MMTLPMLLLALVPTIMIEFVVLLLLRERRRLVLGSSVVINILTNIPLNLYVVYVDSSVMTIVMGELLVVAVEAFWYYLFIRIFPDRTIGAAPSSVFINLLAYKPFKTIVL